MIPEGRPMGRLRFLGVLVCVLGLTAFLRPAEPETKPDSAASRYEIRVDHDPDGIGKFYMGREIAQVMGHQAAGWLDRPEREREEQPAQLFEVVSIPPGSFVADI